MTDQQQPGKEDSYSKFWIPWYEDDGWWRAELHGVYYASRSKNRVQDAIVNQLQLDRKLLRSQRQFEESDKIRDKLISMGVMISDTSSNDKEE